MEDNLEKDYMGMEETLKAMGEKKVVDYTEAA